MIDTTSLPDESVQGGTQQWRDRSTAMLRRWSRRWRRPSRHARAASDRAGADDGRDCSVRRRPCGNLASGGTQALPGIRLPPPRARVIPRLFHRAAASLASLLPGRGDSQPPAAATACWTRPLRTCCAKRKSTHDDIVKRIPARLHRLDQAVRRHGDPDLARARLQDGARHTCATWTGRRCRPCGASTAATRTSITCAGAARTRAPGPGEGAGQSGCRGSAVELRAGAGGRVGAETPVGRPGLAAVLDRFLRRLVPAGDAERVGIWDGASSQVQPGEGSACGAHREDAGHAIVPGHSLRRPGWRVDRQVGRGRPRAPGELARALPSDADAPGATQDAGMRQGRLLLALLADASRNPA